MTEVSKAGEEMIAAQAREIARLTGALNEQRTISRKLMTDNRMLAAAILAARKAYEGLLAVKTEEPLELREEDIPAVKGFFKNLAEKLPAAPGNGT
jgi:hypothetical protein